MEPRITGQWMMGRGRQPVRPQASGGYEAQSMPNPNKGMGPYTGVVKGNYTMSEQPHQNARPELLPNGRSAMELLSGYERRGVEATEVADRANFERDERTNIGVYRDPRWLAMRQALFEAGDPGASRDIGQIRTQVDSPSIAGLYDALDNQRGYDRWMNAGQAEAMLMNRNRSQR